MEHIGGNSSAKVCMTKGKKDCQSQVNDLIERLASWRDESNRQMSDILSYQSWKIDKAFTDLFEEFSEMEVQISELQKERTVLLETISKLNVEIKQILGSTLTLPVAETSEPSGCMVEMLDIKEECLNSSSVNKKNGEEESKDMDHGSLRGDSLDDERAQQNETNHIDDHDHECDSINAIDSESTQGKDIPALEQETIQHKKSYRSEKLITNPSESISPLKQFIKEECVNLSSVTRKNGEESKDMDHGSLRADSLDDERAQQNETNHIDDYDHECDSIKAIESDSIRGKDIPALKQDIIQHNNTYRSEKLIPNPSESTSPLKEFICKVCNFALSTSEQLTIHIHNVHFKMNTLSQENNRIPRHGSKPLIDGITSKVTKIKQKSMKKRVNTMLKCEQCPYQSMYDSTFRRHIKTKHDKIKDHVCSECEYAASTKKLLRYHLDSVHNKGEKLFKCEACPFSCALKVNLNRHMKSVHNIGIMWQCQNCEYTCLQKAMLRRHWDTVHNKGEKRFKCETCPYSSADKAFLNRHMVSVHNMGEDLKCDKCGYVACRKDGLKRHLRRCEGNGVSRGRPRRK